MRLAFGERPATIADVVAASKGGAQVTAVPAARSRMAQARLVLDDFLARDIPVYGLNTGMGANIGHRIDPMQAAAMQRELILPRVAAVGEMLPLETCRAVLFCRLTGLAQGGAGISLCVFDHLCAMLAEDVIPAIPRYGSIGASDLAQTMYLAAAAIGEAKVYFGGTLDAAGAAFAKAGLAIPPLAPKDGLAMGSASSVTVATAALAIDALDELTAVHAVTAALACQGLGANPHLFDARVAGARKAAGQEAAAALFRRILDGSDYFDRATGKVQDAISFRALPQITGTTIAATDHARRETEAELNAAADNPLVLGETSHIRPSANFLTASLALAFDSLAIALTQLATASAQRSIKLMTGRLSGLPNYLSPVGGASAGFVPLQKSIGALHAEIRLRATPASLDALVVSDMVEDIGANSALTVSKLEEQTALLRWLVSIEAMLAAQAVDLRRDGGEAVSLSAATTELYKTVREATPALTADRATGPDAQALHQKLWSAASASALRALACG